MAGTTNAAILRDAKAFERAETADALALVPLLFRRASSQSGALGFADMLPAASGNNILDGVISER
jgi:hypothetical protein